jgi:Tfp pilus tip-associated adhesin PilY1
LATGTSGVPISIGHTTSETTVNDNLTVTGVLNIVTQTKMTELGSDPGSAAGYNYVYSKDPSSGGSGLFFVNDTTTGEMCSKAKAVTFALIF